MIVPTLALLTLAVLPYCDDRRIECFVEKAQVIVVAKVEQVEPAVGFSSGQFLVVQRVNYKVEEILKGSLSDGKINVGHYIVRGSSTSESDASGTHLSASLFSPGKRLVLFLSPDSGKGYIGSASNNPYPKFLALDENCVLLADERTIKHIKRIPSAHIVKTPAKMNSKFRARGQGKLKLRKPNRRRANGPLQRLQHCLQRKGKPTRQRRVCGDEKTNRRCSFPTHTYIVVLPSPLPRRFSRRWADA